MRRLLAACLLSSPLLLSSAASASPSSTVVISEFRTRGPNGANDEFIELFNKSNAPVNIGGYRVMASDAAGTTTLVQQIAASTTLQPRHFYLLANNGSQGYSGAVAPNATYSQGVPDDGGIALFDAGSTVVDQVGMSLGSAYLEGTPLDPLTSNVNQSYERNNGGCAATKDTDDNSIDFRLNASESFPQNMSTNCNTCTGVTCVAPPNLECWIAQGVCTAGSCAYTQLPVNTVCSDGDACTVGDTCDAGGVCISGSAATCTTPPPAFCSDPQTLVTPMGPGLCSSGAGCSYSQQTQHCTFGCNGTTKACNPDPCTSVSCNTPPTNGCYLPAGVCTNGTCIYTPEPRGAPCSDGDACTIGDACDDSGGCLSGAPKLIDDGNACTIDACNTTTGLVSHTNATDGTDCDDGDQCNGIAVCKTGTCTNGAAVTCNTPPIGGCYAATGTCSKATGACTYTPLTGGSSCNDADACTTDDECDGNGACGGSTLACPSSDTCFDSTTSRHLFGGSCQPGLGTCSFSHTDKNCPFGCDDGSGLCAKDPCVGVVCNSPPDQCHVGVCSGGSCSYVVTVSGTSCDDGDPCTNSDQCSSGGACAGTPLLCTVPPAPTCLDSRTSRQFQALGTCSTGTCDYGAPQDLPCSSGCNATTGLCDADPCASIACDQPPDQCHVGTCANGVCSYAAAKPDASSCDDGNPCTEQDVCEAGICAGEPKACNTPPPAKCTDANTSQVHDSATTCNAILGECGSYASHDTTCPTGCNAGTGRCNGDPCATKVCDSPPGSCFLGTGTCASSNGSCTYGFRGTGVSCDDNNLCTDNDACDGAGKCIGTPIASCSADGGTVGGDASTGGANSGGSAATGGASSGDGAVGTGGSTIGTGGAIASSGGRSGSSGGNPGLGVDGGSSDAGPPLKIHDTGGCGCSVPNRTSGSPWALAIAGVTVLAARRRKPRFL